MVAVREYLDTTRHDKTRLDETRLDATRQDETRPSIVFPAYGSISQTPAKESNMGSNLNQIRPLVTARLRISKLECEGRLSESKSKQIQDGLREGMNTIRAMEAGMRRMVLTAKEFC